MTSTRKPNCLFFLSVFTLILFNANTVYAQANAHAHNDYLRESPFYDALTSCIQSFEIDIYMIDGKIYVAHDKEDIRHHLNFRDMYIIPIKRHIDSIISLQLIIDIKSYTEELLIVLQSELEEIKEQITTKDQYEQKKITIVLSGDLDKNHIANNVYPLFFLDGRPSDLNKKHILQHCKMISDDFENYCNYRGIGKPSKKEIKALIEQITRVHEVNLPIRFWNTKNHANVWRLLDQLNVDLISVDDYINFNNYNTGAAWIFRNNQVHH